MPSRSAVRRAAAAIAVFEALTLGAPATPEAPPRSPLPSAGATTPIGVAPFAGAATAARAGNFAAARALLEPLTTQAPPEIAGRARTILGLLARRFDVPELAIAELSVAGAPELDDWRLWTLADADAELHRTDAARQALGQLLASHPDSPLRPRVVVRLAKLAGDAGDLAAERLWIDQARAERLPHADAVELEQNAWRSALDHADDQLLANAGRRLLVVAPLEASKLRVVDVLAQRIGSSDWRLWLSADALLARARALLDADVPAGARTTLAAIPEAQRGVAWKLLDAEALTASGQGAEAVASLEGVTSADPAEIARLAWDRASGARSAARSRQGHRPSADVVERFRRLAREQWLAVVRVGADPGLTEQALKRLFADYVDADRLDEAVATLRQLTALDPDDRTGSRALWERGWEAYERHDLVRAEKLWSDLTGLYPTTNSARSARYWSARALDRLGRRVEARKRYLEVLAADTADFYARQAGLRLADEAAATSATAVERDVWPSDPRLARAQELADLGLETLARTELDLVGDRAESRARAALSALVLARTGDRRASLGALLHAFPELATAHQARVPERALALYYPTDFRDTIIRAARAEGLPPALVYGIVHQESAFDAAATSRVGARGLMQLMPATGREVARGLSLPFSTSRLLEPDYSVRLGSHYFRELLDRFDGRVELALASYNGGPGRISRLWRAAGPDVEIDRFVEGLDIDESRDFVKRILILTESYRSLYPDLG